MTGFGDKYKYTDRMEWRQRGSDKILFSGVLFKIFLNVVSISEESCSFSFLVRYFFWKPTFQEFNPCVRGMIFFMNNDTRSEEFNPCVFRRFTNIQVIPYVIQITCTKIPIHRTRICDHRNTCPTPESNPRHFAHLGFGVQTYTIGLFVLSTCVQLY